MFDKTTGAAIILAFLLGAAALYGYQKMTRSDLVFDDEIYDDVFDDKFFNQSRSPFEEMDRIQSRLDRMFAEPRGMPGFDRWFDNEFGSFPLSQITTREDSEHLYYVLEVGDQQVADINVETADGYLSITANLSSESEGSHASTRLSQRFPIPAGVDEGSLSAEHRDDEIIISFLKQK